MDFVVRGKVTNITQYGAFVKLQDDYTGLVHISEISDFFVEDICNFLQINKEYDFYVLATDAVQKRYKLSYKKLHPELRKNQKVNDKMNFEESSTGFTPLRKMIHDLNEGLIEDKKNDQNQHENGA